MWDGRGTNFSIYAGIKTNPGIYESKKNQKNRKKPIRLKIFVVTARLRGQRVSKQVHKHFYLLRDDRETNSYVYEGVIIKFGKYIKKKKNSQKTSFQVKLALFRGVALKYHVTDKLVRISTSILILEEQIPMILKV